MTDPLSSLTHALLDLHLDLNFNMNPETIVHADTHNGKYREPDTFYESFYLKPLNKLE